jgi:hypothetical protein
MRHLPKREISIIFEWRCSLSNFFSIDGQSVLASSAEDQAEDDFVHFGVLKTILMEQLKVGYVIYIYIYIYMYIYVYIYI